LQIALTRPTRDVTPRRCTNTKTVGAIHKILDLKCASHDSIQANNAKFTLIEGIVGREKMQWRARTTSAELSNAWPPRTLSKHMVRCTETADGTQGTALSHASAIAVVLGVYRTRTRTEVKDLRAHFEQPSKAITGKTIPRVVIEAELARFSLFGTTGAE